MTPPLPSPSYRSKISPQKYQGEDCMAGYVVWRHGIKKPWCIAKFPYKGMVGKVSSLDEKRKKK